MIASMVCFGIPSIFSFSSTACTTCDSFSRCRAVAYRALGEAQQTEAVRKLLIDHERYAIVGVPVEHGAVGSQQGKPALSQGRTSRSRARGYELTPENIGLVAACSEPVGKVLTKLFKRGHDIAIRVALRDGREPLADVCGYRSIKVALRELRNGLDRAKLRALLAEELGWSASSAKSEATLICGILSALGVAVESNGCLVVSPNITGQTCYIRNREQA